MLSQDPEYIVLKKTEQEIARKTKIALAKEETLQKTREHQMQRAKTSIGLEDIFSNPKEMLEFAEHTVEHYKPFIIFCSKALQSFFLIICYLLFCLVATIQSHTIFAINFS